ncbi:hypothetical protein A9974_24415 [Achromobacter sp. UMC71]|nr:hypothetical protein [Achromobacter sp. UMC71]
MKPLLLLALCALAGAARANCPSPEQWTRSFQQAHADFYRNPERHDPSLYTPGFDAALRGEWAYAKGEVGHLDYDPWLGAQDGDMAASPVFDAESAPEGTAIVAMRYPFALEPGGPQVQQTVHLILKRQAPQCWRLDDFITPQGESLRRLYATAP